MKFSFYEVVPISDNLTSSDVKKHCSFSAYFDAEIILNMKIFEKKMCINASPSLHVKNERSIAKFGALVPELRHFINS